MKRRRTGLGVVDISQRELGVVAPRSFAHHAAASEELVLRLGIYRKLNKHRGCVNTVCFNQSGDVLISGSDDRMIIIWDWEVGNSKYSFHSGHTNNVFQARFMPYSDDRSIVTCAADGEVRHALIPERGEPCITLLGEHEGRAHKLAIEPGNPHILYSSGEDGLVQHFDLRTRTATRLFICKSFRDRPWMPVVNLNAIAIDQRNPNLLAIGGSDEFARVYDIRKYKLDGSSDDGRPTNCFCPPHLIGEDVGITGLAFSEQSELLISYHDEQIYLFNKDQGLGSDPITVSPNSNMDTDRGESSSADAEADPRFRHLQIYSGHQNSDTVKGVSFFGPSCEYVTSGSDCGRIFIWRKKDGYLLRVMEGDKDVVNCIEPHPYSTVMASSGIDDDIKIWTPNSLERGQPVNLDKVAMFDGLYCYAVDPEYFVADEDEDTDEDGDEDDNGVKSSNGDDDDDDDDQNEGDDKEEEEDDDDDYDDDDDNNYDNCDHFDKDGFEIHDIGIDFGDDD